MIQIRLHLDLKKLPRIPLLTSPFIDELERRAAYERVFFGSPDGALVLADMLKSWGALSPSFTAPGFDPVVAAHNDGAKHAVLSILREAGGDPDKLAQAITRNALEDTRNE